MALPLTEHTPTDAQIKIMRHALGWPEPYRNYYNSGRGCTGYEDCCKLCLHGYMKAHPSSLDEMNESVMFKVTQKGIDAVQDSNQLNAQLLKACNDLLNLIETHEVQLVGMMEKPLTMAAIIEAREGKDRLEKIRELVRGKVGA